MIPSHLKTIEETLQVLTHVAQLVLGVVLFLVFNHFSKVYVRRFLRSWSRSWFAFAAYMLCSALLILLEDRENYHAFILPLSFIAQVGCFTQIILLLIGTYQLVYFKPLKRNWQLSILVASILFALVIVLINSHDSDPTGVQYVLRTGSRTLLAALGLTFTSLIVWTNRIFSKGIGQRFLALSFTLAGVEQFFYFGMVVYNAVSKPLAVPAGFGLVDILFTALVGISMVVWLLEDEREKLKKANKELDSFLYSTSHDLRAPIASILGLTYLSKVELKEEKALQYMEMIEERVKKLDLVIGDILSLSRTKKFDVKIEPIDFDKLLDESINNIQFSKGASAIRLHCERKPDQIFYSDYHQMKMVLNNLISNAVKYHRLNQPEPYILVSFKKTDERVEIVVEDNGQGIPSESVAKIFDMFYRASVDTEGTGLGLYIVKEALGKINGTIAVESAQGLGSRFTIILEQAEAER